MPQIGGLELASRLSKQQPDVCVLFTSGYAGEALEQYGLFEGDSHLLPKPFTYSELARKVREALDS